jgi:hypothetical protein
VIGSRNVLLGVEKRWRRLLSLAVVLRLGRDGRESGNFRLYASP